MYYFGNITQGINGSYYTGGYIAKSNVTIAQAILYLEEGKEIFDKHGSCAEDAKTKTREVNLQKLIMTVTTTTAMSFRSPQTKWNCFITTKQLFSLVITKKAGPKMIHLGLNGLFVLCPEKFNVQT